MTASSTRERLIFACVLCGCIAAATAIVLMVVFSMQGPSTPAPAPVAPATSRPDPCKLPSRYHNPDCQGDILLEELERQNKEDQLERQRELEEARQEGYEQGYEDADNG